MSTATGMPVASTPSTVTDRTNHVHVGSKTMQHLNEALARERMREMRQRPSEATLAQEQAVQHRWYRVPRSPRAVLSRRAHRVSRSAR